MALKDMFKSKSSYFDIDLKTKDEVLTWISKKFYENELVSDEQAFLNALNKRETEDSTGIGDGIGIPHALIPQVNESTIGFIRLKKPIDWQSMDDKPVDLIFLIATNGEDGNEHLFALSELSTYLMKKEYQDKFRTVKNFNELSEIFVQNEKEEKSNYVENISYDIVGITACPTGIAHTYMAQEKLLETAKELGLTAKIETQGRRGTEDKLTIEDIENAKYIILGHDKALSGLDRFNGKEVIDTSTKEVIYKAKELIIDYDNKKKIKINAKKSDDTSGELSLKKFKDVKGVLLAGVSKMLPFVVAGGIVLGLAFLIDFIAGNGSAKGDYGQVSSTAGWFAGLGKIAMSMMVPVLGAYIAHALVGNQGLMPGFVGGLLANSNSFVYGNSKEAWNNLWGKLLPGSLPTESGFIGAIAAAYLTGLIIIGLTRLMQNFHKGLQGVRDIVFIPVISLLGVGIGMFALNIPLGYILKGIEEGLKWLAQHNLLILVGAILGLMMCVDMGGPINKIAYVIGTLSVASPSDGGIEVVVNGVNQSNVLMAAAMAAGMVPPLGVAFSTVMFRKYWSTKDKDAAKANWLMGLCFISEGAIPFMVEDPKRVPISAMSGGLITGLIVGGLSIGLPAPHGGVFVFPLLKSYLFNNGTSGTAIGFGIGMYVFAILLGSLIMSTILGFWRMKDIKKDKLIIK